MTKRIAIDDATYVTLKKLAEADGRSIVGEIRFVLRGYAVEGGAQASVGNSYRSQIALKKPQHSGNRGEGPDDSSELQQMISRLQYFDEGSPEYEEAMARISELQK